ncbi:MAG: HNH endonuclease signature motif containing protein [Dehalococcoidia bacterium]
MNRRVSSIAGAVVLLLLGAAIALLLARGTGNRNSTTTSESPSVPVLGQRTKTQSCVAGGALPDRGCTPGAIFTDATKERICVSGYSSSVRNVPVEVKNQVYAEYGIASHAAGQYEVDHLISLELGGSNDIANLWPEAASPRPGFHEKDRYENYAHDQVCSGQISLQEAQRRIAGDWLKYWTDAGRP